VRVEYVCKYCHHLIGELDQPNWSYADVERYCGLGNLTPLERMESISYEDSGALRLRTVCDYCKRALETHPEVLVEGKLLQ